MPIIVGFAGKENGCMATVRYDESMEAYDVYLEFAKDLAYKAGKVLRDNFDTSVATDTVELKKDSSPVTKVDKAINQLVIESVRERFPDHGVRGEEADSGDGTEEYQWLCDPLDGTRPYILGIPCSTFMLALTRQGEVLVAVIYEPHFDKLYYAIKGGGAFCNGQPIHVSSQSLQGNSVLAGASTYKYAKGLVEAGAKLEPISGGGYKAVMIADGRGMATMRAGSDFHDVGPSALIIEEAGGMVTGIDGASLVYDKPIGGIIMSNGVDHDKLVAIARMTKD